jgi:hypothetical protein
MKVDFKNYFLAVEEDTGFIYASFWKRLLSALIDLITIYPLFFLFIYVSKLPLI